MLSPGPYIEHVFGDDLDTLYRRGGGRWITCAVQHSIPWPEKDVAVTYDGRQYFLRGIKQHGERSDQACISVWTTNSESLSSVVKELYKFTSILGWYKRGYVDVDGYITGSGPVRYGSGIKMFAHTIAGGAFGFDCNYMPLVPDETTRIALAFWREGMKLEHVHTAYSFLSFYKVIESQFENGREKVRWITDSLPTLEGRAKTRIEELLEKEADVSKHIFESGRCAVAHASLGRELIDPDIPADKEQIQKDLDVVKALAEKYIREELCVPDEMDVYRERNRLEPIYEYLTEEQIKELEAGGSILRKRVGLRGVEISVNEWPHAPTAEFCNLQLEVDSAHNGTVALSALNKQDDLCLNFLFDFTQGKAHVNLETSDFLPVDSGGNASSVIAFLKYQKAVIGNGQIEIRFPNGAVVGCEVVIPVNMDIGRTFERIDQQIAALECILPV